MKDVSQAKVDDGDPPWLINDSVGGGGHAGSRGVVIWQRQGRGQHIGCFGCAERGVVTRCHEW